MKSDEKQSYPWPSDWKSFGEELEHEWLISTLQQRRVLPGKSGAQVVLVNIVLPDYQGLAILKLSVDRYRPEKDEFDRHSAAEKLNPKFAVKHLPKIVKVFRKGDRTAYLMTVAGEGLNYTTSFFELPATRQYLAVQKVSTTLLTEWNHEYLFNEASVNSVKILEVWLKYRIGADSRLPDLLQESFGLSPDTPTFRLNGRNLPNPYLFAKRQFPEGSQIVLTPIIGRFHGDLHGDNLLVGEMEGRKNDFYIIDLAFFEDGLPLFFDHAYLEFSLLLRERGNIGLERWIKLVESLLDIESNIDVARNLTDKEDHGLLLTASYLRGAIKSWVTTNHQHRKQDMTNQLLLARVAVGLNYANKQSLDDCEKRSEKLKTFAFIYAAESLIKLLAFNKIVYPLDGPVAKIERNYPQPSSISWRQIWQHCDGFDSRRNAYILIAGAELGSLPDESKKVLGRLPWSIALDFDPRGDVGGLVAHAKPLLARQRGFHFLLPDQFEQVSFNEGICWLMAAGWHERPDSIPATPQVWKQCVPQKIRELSRILRSATVPRPIYVLVMARGLSIDWLTRTVFALDEVLGEQQQTIVVSDNEEDISYSALKSIERCTEVQCKYIDFTIGVHQMLDDEQNAAFLQIPRRDQNTGETVFLIIDPAKVALFSETIEIVHDGLANAESLSDGDEVADFLHGNTITWKELDLNVDVERDVTHEILKTIRDLLASSRSVSYMLGHTPGAGGTTVSRRVAWTLRNEFPSVILKTYTEATSIHIEELFHSANLPVFVVIEQARLSTLQRDRLFNELKARNVRFVFLDVVRQQRPRDTEFSSALADPMTAQEARRFLGRYAERCLGDRRETLDKLVRNEDMRSFRSAFFFGFFAFLDEFQYIPQYVRAHLTELSQLSRQTLTYLALITRYSLERLPVESLCIMADRSPNTIIRIEEMLGEAAKNLIMFDGNAVAIVHPLIAQEILKSELQPKNATSSEAWLAGLTDFCISFISLMGKYEHRDSGAIKTILEQIFIDRKIWGEIGPTRGLFSELIIKIPNLQGQNRVLQKLCKEFPESAVFWDHLGRHFCNRLNSYKDAEGCFQKAIDIEPNGDVHYHGLGMVYRFHVKNYRVLYDTESLDEVWLSEIKPLFEKAEFFFRKSYKLDPDSGQYPLVTHIQLINETIERLFHFWKQQMPEDKRRYQEFFNTATTVSTWCREKIGNAEDLLNELKHLQANAPLSRHTVECEGKIKEYFGDPSFMINGLSALLNRDDILKPPLRRLLAHTYIRKSEQAHTEMNQKTTRNILTLMRENLNDDPANGADIKLWFKVFRKLPEFSIIEAIDRMTTLAYQAESIDAFYYLYILHFINAREGVQNSLNEAKKYLEMCRRKAPILLSKKSFEWWASTSLNWPCPLINEREIGEWDKQIDFFDKIEKLGFVEGVIDEIKSFQQGTIIVNGMPAFFVPRGKISVGTRNRKVRFFLGFSYEGLRAWNVEPID